MHLVHTSTERGVPERRAPMGRRTSPPWGYVTDASSCREEKTTSGATASTSLIQRSTTPSLVLGARLHPRPAGRMSGTLPAACFPMEGFYSAQFSIQKPPFMILLPVRGLRVLPRTTRVPKKLGPCSPTTRFWRRSAIVIRKQRSTWRRRESGCPLG